MLKNIFKQIRAHPLSSTIIILGYFVSMFIISMGVSVINQTRQHIIDISNGVPNHELHVGFEFSKDIDSNVFLNKVKESKTELDIQLIGINANINNKPGYDITCEIFTKIPEWVPPTIEGSYFTTKMVNSNEKIALIGKNFIGDTSKKGKDRYIDISGTEFKVVGVMGRKDSTSLWDNDVIIPFDSVPENVMSLYKNNLIYSFLFKKNNDVPYHDVQGIIDFSKQIDANVKISLDIPRNQKDLNSKFWSESRPILSLMGMTLLVAIINVIHISYYWFFKRKKEIGIRKAYGATNFRIFLMFYSEMTFLILISSVLALLLHFLISLFVKEIFGYSIAISIINFIFGFLVSLICGFITSFIPMKTSLNIEPSLLIKN